MINKNQLRQELYVLRKEVGEKSPDISIALMNNVARFLGQSNYSCVGFYRPFRQEPDLTACVVSWAKQAAGRSLAVPKVDDVHFGKMHFCRWMHDMPMIKGSFGIAEPAEDVEIVPDVIFSPCVGVNRQGYRLGNGGGFFDRYLRSLSEMGIHPVTVAVAFDELILQENYQEEHDIAFDWIVTQSGAKKAG